MGERLDNDPNETRYGCFLPDLAGLARRPPAPTSRLLNRMIALDSQGFLKSAEKSSSLKFLMNFAPCLKVLKQWFGVTWYGFVVTVDQRCGVRENRKSLTADRMPRFGFGA